MILSQGAESIIKLEEINNQKVIVKERISKKYRIKELDDYLIRHRTKVEVKILKKLENIIKVPKVFQYNENTIIMEYIEGIRLRDFLNQDNYIDLMKRIGKIVSILHENDIIHHDLTTSNMIYKDNEIYLIDFGLSFISKRIEDKAVDLHLFVEAINSKHFNLKNAFQYFLEGYREYKDYEKVLEQLKEIELRGRYKHKT
ncbi:MAG: KEOPS complex kinase/ATPase Bud32 [Candidatus Woesearchaeota archaeon]